MALFFPFGVYRQDVFSIRKAITPCDCVNLWVLVSA